LKPTYLLKVNFYLTIKQIC